MKKKRGYGLVGLKRLLEDVEVKITNMKNEFQKWLVEQGYYRENGNGLWSKDGKEVSGKRLSIKLDEWRKLKQN